MESLPPVLLGPESGRKVAEHVELFGKSEQLPDPRDEAVGLLRRSETLLSESCYCKLAFRGTCPPCRIVNDIRALLARIDK